MTATTVALERRPAQGLLADLIAREPTLARFGLAMWLAMIPTAIALGIDERTLRDANIWLKPLKFMMSVGLFSLTTAWFVGMLPQARRRAWPVRAIVATLVAAGGFEIGYIVLQAALGQGSHYNVGDPIHATLYTLMAVGAIAMTATQPVLAWEIARHGTHPAGSVFRASVVVGLVLTFVLGAASGMPLGGLQPPSGAGMPVIGWHWTGDLRPAHFVGLHAHQLVPLAGLALGAMRPSRARLGLWMVVAGYVVLWGALMAAGFVGAGAPGR